MFYPHRNSFACWCNPKLHVEGEYDIWEHFEGVRRDDKISAEKCFKKTRVKKKYQETDEKRSRRKASRAERN